MKNDRQNTNPAPRAWVLVIGMHRSGTSAMAGALHGLGLELPVDLMIGGGDNPAHNESNALSRVNDALLGILGGTWDDPPAVEVGWETRADMAATMETVSGAVANAFPFSAPAVWKDPRTSLLLPYWRRVLSPIAGVVLIWRSPIAAARSLRTRDRIVIDQGLALWRHYNEAALENVFGCSHLIIEYDDMVNDRTASSALVGSWLSEVVPGFTLRADGVAQARAAVSPFLRHHRGDPGAPPAACRELVERLAELGGAHYPSGQRFTPIGV